ncbi:MAG: DnaB-like helicase N-terminal domain-containing protein, partial [Alphaproteobacteria bacterium]
MATVLDHPQSTKNEPATRTPREAPNNMEAEQALLGAILANNEALNHVGTALRPEDFYAELHQRIYRAILLFHDKGLIANPITLKQHFAGQQGVEDQYLARLVGAATSIINVRDYANLIRDAAIKRRLIGVGEEVVIKAFDEVEHSGMTQVEMAEQQLFNLATEGDAEGGFT